MTRAAGGRAAGQDGRWLVLAVIGVAQLMVVLDATIVNIALPAAQQDLGFSDDRRQWVITAYSLSFGGLLLLGGKLSDVYGRKETFTAGLAGFALASALGGLAQSFGWLVGARALQGAFGALLAPAALGLLTTTFTEPADRGRAFGVFGAIAGSGGAVGLLLGGALTEYATWRWCLFVNLAFAAAAIAGSRVLPATRHGDDRERAPISVTSVVTITAGLVAVVYGFSHASTTAWTDPLTVVSIAVGLVLLVVFVALQARLSVPLLPLRLVLDRDRGGSCLVIGLVGASMFGIFLFLTYYLELTLGLSPLRTGAAFLPLTLSIVFGSTVVGGRLIPRLGPRAMVVSGGLGASVGLLLLSRIRPDTGYDTVVLPALLVMGVGLGTAFSAAIATATSGVGPADAGVASAVVNAVQQVGGSLGMALLSTLSARAVASYTAGHAGARDLVVAGAVHGYQVAFRFSAALLLLAALAGGLLIRARTARRTENVTQRTAPVAAAYCALVTVGRTG